MSTQVKLKERESEIEILKNRLLEKEDSISNFERELAKYRDQVEQQQKKISDSLQIEVLLIITLCKKINNCSNFSSSYTNIVCLLFHRRQ